MDVNVYMFVYALHIHVYIYDLHLDMSEHEWLFNSPQGSGLYLAGPK